MTAYEMLMATLDGKAMYFAVKWPEVRAIWAYSPEHAQANFPGWEIY